MMKQCQWYLPLGRTKSSGDLVLGLSKETVKNAAVSLTWLLVVCEKETVTRIHW